MKINISPVSKPRMTQRDRWASRPVVNKYFKFCNELKNTYKKEIVSGEVELAFQVPMPKSWSKKKKAEMDGKPHQQRPDIDNYIKAVLDALTQEDSHIYDIKATKYWSEKGSIEITEKYS